MCLDDEIQWECQRFDGMRILGPNSMGILVPKLHLNASFAVTSKLSKDGTVALISMSSRLCNAVLDWAARENVGFSQINPSFLGSSTHSRIQASKWLQGIVL